MPLAHQFVPSVTTGLRMFARNPQSQKAFAAAAFYTVACIGVASLVEKRNISHVFRQIGQN